ncbi:MAG TPA: MarC family protein [Spirochaetota bacterium]|nr:MarC family protein [Spirochaetota bacterium]OPZ35685.1 MAG: putative antibiotic transporter [Spirochaetes bacterium ADurb.BinA120]HNU92862.1 MarC family protein [Spirochaetota bacterium]HPI13319.1 MarC family protein [Spirochaetota bacterium]HPO45352.1 MarC family protein [Spirochaetota bacterium]
MEGFFKNLLLAFIPVFVAVDAIGTLPIYIALTDTMGRAEKRLVLIESLVTALCLAVGFIFLGKLIFRFLGITVGDFMVAGGAVLFCIAILDILGPQEGRKISQKQLGVVPLGTPLLAGPALLATSLLIIEEYGIVPTIVSVTLNILIAGGIFSLSNLLIRLLGEAGSKALSKITSLFLAAIAVMIVRKGLVFLYSGM